ncbi:MAG: alpha/beta fold hydrolase [Candidatus Protochlamydia sp.]|nr:alpha/beta fold hydrolase [Candidatus Protochlamydia sp.]
MSSIEPISSQGARIPINQIDVEAKHDSHLALASSSVAKNVGILPDHSDKLSSLQGSTNSDKMNHSFHAEKKQPKAETYFQMISSAVKNVFKGVSKEEVVVNPETRGKEEIVVNSETGVSKFSMKNKIESAFNKFTEFFTRDLVKSLGHNFFPMYANNVKNEALQKKYTPEDKNQFKQSYTSDEMIQKKLQELKINPEENRAEIARIEELASLVKFELLNEKGAETRKNLVALGGEPLALKTSDGAKLDGFFLDASKFRQKLQDAGGELITFSGHGETRPLKGIAFDFNEWKEKKGAEPLLNILKDLNVLSYTNEQLSGWTPVKYNPKNKNEPSKIILVPTVSLPGNENDQGWIKKVPRKETFEINEKKFTNPPNMEPIDTKSKGGTVILSQGNVGVYEMYKDEAITFLFQGMNVVMFNYRGSGQSKGVPSDEKYHKDIETVFQFAKKRTEQEDSKILFKGLCFGGGASAYAAGKHPQTNIILDQTYSSFRDLVEENAIKRIKVGLDGLHKNLDPEMKSEFYSNANAWVKEKIVPIIGQCARLIAPNFEVAKNLTKNTGNKALFYIHDDATIPLKNVEENIKAANKGGGNIKVFSSPGEHGNKWMDLKAKGELVYKDILKASENIGVSHNEKIKELRSLKYQKEAEWDSEIQRGQYSSKEKIEKLKDELKSLSTALRELEAKRNSELDTFYSEQGLDRIQMEKDIQAIRYHARNHMFKFLETSVLSDSLI